MRIAIFGCKGIPARYGGVERHTEELATRLAIRNHQVTVYCRSHYTTEDHYCGVRLIRCGAIQQKNLEMITHSFNSIIRSLLIGEKIDIAHVQSIDPGILSFLLKIKARVVVTSHGWAYRTHDWHPFFRKVSELAERAFVITPDSRIVVSRTLKRYYESKYNCKVHYIPNGVRLPLISKPDNPRIVITDCIAPLEKVTLNTNEYLIAVGRILPLKGIDVLIQAWRKVRSDKKLVIVGSTSYDTKYMGDLLSSADKRVIFTGNRYGKELSTLYSSCYCSIVPSRVEGLAMTLLEAMSYGKCVVYSDIPENKEVAEGVGVLFKNKDTDDLAQKIQFAIDNPSYCEDFGIRARERVEREYNWDDIVTQTENVYKSLL